MKVNTNISIDAELKKNAVELFKEFGLDLSTAISLFLSQSVREQKIPFEIKRDVSSRTVADKNRKSKDKKTAPVNSNNKTEKTEATLDDSNTIRNILEPAESNSTAFTDEVESSVDALLDDFFK